MIGTDKQMSWANDIRERAMPFIDRFLDTLSDTSVAQTPWGEPANCTVQHNMVAQIAGRRRRTDAETAAIAETVAVAIRSLRDSDDAQAWIEARHFLTNARADIFPCADIARLATDFLAWRAADETGRAAYRWHNLQHVMTVMGGR